MARLPIGPQARSLGATHTAPCWCSGRQSARRLSCSGTGRTFSERANLDLLGAALTLILALLIVLLPVQHGVFHADRTARRLDGAPQGASGLAPPVWVVDRTADRVTLLGRGADGQARLVALKADQLDGVAVVGVGSLNEALGGTKP